MLDIKTGDGTVDVAVGLSANRFMLSSSEGVSFVDNGSVESLECSDDSLAAACRCSISAVRANTAGTKGRRYLPLEKKNERY